MRKILCMVAMLAFLTSCEKDGLSTERTQNPNYQVDFLFEKDNVKVYRFYDGRYHYFTSKGETISTQMKLYSTGKTTIIKYYDENINGN